MINETEKLEIIKTALTVILESDIMTKDDHEYSDAFRFGYLKGTINTIIKFINDEVVMATQHEI